MRDSSPALGSRRPAGSADDAIHVTGPGPAPGSRHGRTSPMGHVQAAAERRAARRRWLLLSPAMLIICGIGIMPLGIIVGYSFMEQGNYAGVKWEFTFESWINLILERDIFDDTLGWNYAHISILLRSIGLALMTVVITLLVGLPTAYFIATRPESQRNFWLFLVALPFLSNLLVRTFAMMLMLRDDGYINNTLLLLGVIDEPITLIYTNTAVAIGLVYTYLPLMVMPLYASMEKLNFDLVEAGYDLYAGRLQVLTRIILPSVKPGIVAGCILVFIPAIGAYVTAKVLGGGKNLMIGNLIANQFGTSRDWPLGSAIALFMMIVVMIALIVYVRNSTARQ